MATPATKGRPGGATAWAARVSAASPMRALRPYRSLLSFPCRF